MVTLLRLGAHLWGFLAGCLTYMLWKSLMNYTNINYLLLNRPSGTSWYFTGISNALAISDYFRPSALAWIGLQLGTAFLIYLVISWLVARRTGQVTTGLRVGLWAGLTFGLISTITTIWPWLQILFFSPNLSAYAPLGDEQAVSQEPPTTALLSFIGFQALIYLLLIGLGTGVVAGLLGGLAGRRFHRP